MSPSVSRAAPIPERVPRGPAELRIQAVRGVAKWMVPSLTPCLLALSAIRGWVHKWRSRSTTVDLGEIVLYIVLYVGNADAGLSHGGAAPAHRRPRRSRRCDYGGDRSAGAHLLSRGRGARPHGGARGHVRNRSGCNGPQPRRMGSWLTSSSIPTYSSTTCEALGSLPPVATECTTQSLPALSSSRATPHPIL